MLLPFLLQTYGAIATRGRVSFVEFEVPLVSTSGRMSFMEFEVPMLGTKGRISKVEVEVPAVGGEDLTESRYRWRFRS